MIIRHICIFRRGSVEGFAAAYIIGDAIGFDRVKFFCIDAGEPFPVPFKYKHVFLAGFDLSPEVLIPLAEDARKVVLLNTHPELNKAWQSIEKLPDEVEYHYRTGYNAARLAWGYFYPGATLPDLFRQL